MYMYSHIHGTPLYKMYLNLNDPSLRLWVLQSTERCFSFAPTLDEVYSKNLQAGPIFTCQSNADMPALTLGHRGIGGS